MIQYSRLVEPTECDREQLTALIRQLTGNGRKLTLEALRTVASMHYLLVARDTDKEDRIVGTALLAIMRTVSHVNGQIEDVVVDEAYRGQGIAKGLLMRLVVYARAVEVERIDLGSEPHRAAANHLYDKFGFVKRDTNLYRLSLLEPTRPTHS